MEESFLAEENLLRGNLKKPQERKKVTLKRVRRKLLDVVVMSKEETSTLCSHNVSKSQRTYGTLYHQIWKNKKRD
jgi:hypothetical protein